MKKMKKVAALALVMAVILSLFCDISTASAMNIAVLPEGDYVISPSAYSDYALDAEGGGSDARTNIWLYQKNCTEAQIFSVVHVGEGWIKIVLKKNPRMCINVVNGDSKNGARLWLWPDDGTDSCYYRTIDCGDGTYKLQSRIGSGYRILDLSNNQAYNGAVVQLWDLHDTPAGKWRFTPVNSVPSVSFPTISSSQYISAYALASSGRIYAYTSANLSSRTGGWVDAATDLCRIVQISGNAVQVSYPVSYGRRTAWFPLNQFLTSSTSTNCKTSQGSFTVYRRASGYTTIGSVYPNDTVYVLGSSNGRTQLIYPVSGGLWKMGFANASDVQRFLGESGNTTPAPDAGNYAAYTGVDYRSQTSNSRRIAACDKAVQMATVLWTAPCSFPTWKSSDGIYNTVTATDGSSATEFKAGKTYQGIPYSMAGRDYDDIRWIELLNNGISTSGMSAWYEGRTKTTAKGIDCSYLVSEVLSVGCGTAINMTTYDMLASPKFKKINRSDMLPGDIFLNGEHVMLFMGKTSNGAYAVIEANAKCSRVVYKTYTASDLGSYGCYRYTGF